MPEDSYPPLLQGAVVIKNGPPLQEAHQFLDFLLSAADQKATGRAGLESALGRFLAHMDQQAIFLTFRLATLTTLILLAIAVPLGYWLAYGRARWKPLVEAAVALPLVLPPTVLGFYLLVLMGPRTAAGRALSAVFGHPAGFLLRRAPGRLRHLQPALCRAAHDLGLPLGRSGDPGGGGAAVR